MLAWEFLLLLVLILVNGFFALAEIAMVSSRRVRLQQRANEGDAGARTALELIAEPTRFLSTVQIGITLVGILAGAFGGALVAETVSEMLRRIPALDPYADLLGLSLVVLVLTYLSLVFGELLPKRIALTSPERFAALTARPLWLLSRVAAPVVHLLAASTHACARLLGIRPAKEQPVTAEEIRILIEQGESAGIFEPTEQDIVESALHLDDLRLSAILTPRTAIEWLDLAEPAAGHRATIIGSRHSHFPVAQAQLDHVVGVVRGRDVLVRELQGQTADLAGLATPPLFIPESRSVLRTLELFKRSGQHMALVIDEFGGIQGVVTLTDLMKALVGDIRSLDRPRPSAVRRDDGAWLLDGRLPVHELKGTLDLDDLPREVEAGYETLGGLVMTALGRIPAVGDRFTHDRWQFEVLAMDERRVDRVLATPVAAPRPADPTDGEP